MSPLEPSPARAPNRLIHEKSPYLLQHAHNPVDWYPWGPAAFEQAAREGKPIFLSIGYSTCHWCHVMERESFEDPRIAALINRDFIPIKVDREEHPDVDQVYMSAVTALSGQGGWPLTVFLTPELKPFFGGTYFPPEKQWGRPGMTDILPAIAEAWRSRREELAASAEQLTAAVQAHLVGTQPSGSVDSGPWTVDGRMVELLHAGFNQAVATFDEVHGGFGGAPKFPRPHGLSFLLAYHARTGSSQALGMVTTTLDHLARGGIHDHLGGGFHRYSTDEQWLIPHFEKMLYDQALLARAYLEAYRLTKRAEYAAVARRIFEYVLRDLRDPGGAFYAAEDADSEGQEGAFYVWTPEEITRVLGEEDGGLFCRFYGVRPEGNFSLEPRGDGGATTAGRRVSVLQIEQPEEAFAALKGLDPAALTRRLARSREALREARATRVRPHRDEKILASWNGLMIAALAYGGATLDEPRYVTAAEEAADFLLSRLMRDGVLLRRWTDGEARYPGTLEDYAFVSQGLLELYEAGFDPRRLAEAKRLAEAMVTRFWDAAGGGCFLRGKDEAPLIAQSKTCADGATPSGNAVAALVWLKVGRLLHDERLEAFGLGTLTACAERLGAAPMESPQMLMAGDVALGPGREVVIAGSPDAPETRSMLRALHERLLPRTVTIVAPDGEARRALEELVPGVKGKEPRNGQSTAYVCERFVCLAPTTDLATFAQLLDAPQP